MRKAIISLIIVLLLPHFAPAASEFSWEGVYVYSEGGETVTGVSFGYTRTITVKRLPGGQRVAEVRDDGRMTTGDIFVCDVRTGNSNKTMTLDYRGVKRAEGGAIEPKAGEFMTLTRVMVKGKQRFSVEGEFYPENPEPYFEKIR